MNRNEFLIRLEMLLADISSEEREEALQYYKDYFEDAGVENEAEVIRELESPERVAAMIKADLKYADSADAGEFTERGYQDERFERKETPAQRGSGSEYTAEDNGASYQNGTSYSYAGSQEFRRNEKQTGQQTPKTNTGLKIALIILIVLVGAPIVIPLAIGLFCLVFGLLIGVFAFFAGLVIGAAAIMLAGAAIVVFGMILLSAAIPSAILTMGGGLLVFVVGLIGTAATVKLCMVMYPAICRILVNLCRMPFHKRKAVA